MATQVSPTRAAAMQAGAEACIEFLEGTTEYDFNLQLPRHAYMAGVCAYIQALLDAGRRAAINQVEFENALRQSLAEAARNSARMSLCIKLNFLLRSLDTDSALYERHWSRQYQYRGLPLPTAAQLPAAAGQFSTTATVQETEEALEAYYRDVCADAADANAPFAESSDGVQRIIVCINRWRVLVGLAEEDEPQEDSDSEDDDADDDNNGITSGDEEDEEDSGPAQAPEWEQRADGLYYCLICSNHNGIVHKSSLWRHMRMTHGIDEQ